MQYDQSDNYPIIIGAGQVTDRQRILQESNSFIDLAQQSIELCARDTAHPDIRSHVDAFVLVSPLSENLESPVDKICARAGIDPRRREETAFGGNYGQWVVNYAAGQIMEGACSVVLLAGGEALHNDSDYVRNIHANVTRLYQRYAQDTCILGDLRRAETPHEVLHGIDRALHIYPLFENALRAHLKMSLTEYREFLRGYFDKMEDAARGNPLAWFNQGKPADDVTIPTEKNPMINFPYTKFMNPIMAVNQAAAVLMTDTRTALKLGIPREKWVYLHGSSDGTDIWYLTGRRNYHSSPIARATSQAALECAGLKIGDISFFDLYSCFPCAAIISAMEMGLAIQDLPPLSITGGLAYFGGPGGNYSMHAVAHAVQRLRLHPDEYGLITAWGNYLTKHSVGIYGGRQPAQPWRGTRHISLGGNTANADIPVFCEHPQGPATIETYTVLHDAPNRQPYAIIIARLDSGERCLATTEKGSPFPDIMEKEECAGRRGIIAPGHNAPNIFYEL